MSEHAGDNKENATLASEKNAKIIHGTHSENINFEISLLF